MTIKHRHSDQKPLGTEAQGRIFMGTTCDPGRMRTGSSMQFGIGSGVEVIFGRSHEKRKSYEKNSAKCKCNLLVIAGILIYVIYIYC